MSKIDELVNDESVRNREFPVTRDRIYMAHAGVCPLPKTTVDAMTEFINRAANGGQESSWTQDFVDRARRAAASIIGCDSQEIALLGPTSIGLNLVANGMPWEQGDEVVFYVDDYPANVYPWRFLNERGVIPVELRPDTPGDITWDIVEHAINERTRLVSLASCHFLTGCRIDIDRIGRNLHERGILFSLDGIQTVGAFPTQVTHVDFLSADSHKWMLGPAAAGIFYVRESLQEMLRPTLLGSWNVLSPDFIAQESRQYYPGARRYEPGMLNLPGIIGMAASLELLLEIGIDAIANRLGELRTYLVDRFEPLGFRPQSEPPEQLISAIVSFTHTEHDLDQVAAMLAANNVDISLRRNRDGAPFLRFSPHFYNTFEEIDRVAKLLASS